MLTGMPCALGIPQVATSSHKVHKEICRGTSTAASFTRISTQIQCKPPPRGDCGVQPSPRQRAPWTEGSWGGLYGNHTVASQRGGCDPICDLLGSNPNSATYYLCESGQVNLSKPQFSHLQNGMITVRLR